MDFTSILDLLLKSNIKQEDISTLISDASKLDLSDEDDQRILIRKSALLANKEISPQMEDKIIELLKDKGISNELFNYIR